MTHFIPTDTKNVIKILEYLSGISFVRNIKWKLQLYFVYNKRNMNFEKKINNKS